MNKLVVLNNKMYLDYSDIKDYIFKMKDIIRRDLDVVICPSSIFIPFFSGKYDFLLGAQNIAGKPATGEISGLQLKSVGVKYAIIGHMERRINFNETNQIINMKIKDALDNGITPIVCLGDTLEQRECKKTQDVIVKQLRECLRGVDVKEDIIFAYEPCWAIGTDVIPSNEDISSVVDMIKNAIFRVHGVKIRVLYGGSVDESNIKVLEKIKNLDGYLIGRAGIYPDKIKKIMDYIK